MELEQKLTQHQVLSKLIRYRINESKGLGSDKRSQVSKGMVSMGYSQQITSLQNP
jgi:hypothetical protein